MGGAISALVQSTINNNGETTMNVRQMTSPKSNNAVANQFIINDNNGNHRRNDHGNRNDRGHRNDGDNRGNRNNDDNRGNRNNDNRGNNDNRNYDRAEFSFSYP